MWIDLDLVSLDTFIVLDPVIFELIGLVGSSIPQASTAQIATIDKRMMNMSANHIISCSHPVWVERYVTIGELRPESRKLCIGSIVVVDNSINLVVLCIALECEIEPARSLFIFVGGLGEGTPKCVAYSRDDACVVRFSNPSAFGTSPKPTTLRIYPKGILPLLYTRMSAYQGGLKL